MTDDRSATRRYTLFSIVSLFFLSALIMLRQLTSDGYFSCIIEDSYTYTSWAWQFVEVLKEGTIYPRWLPLNFWGYGSPTFVLYPPLAFYLVGFFNIFTHSVITAMNITKFAALFLSAAGMFFLVREFYSEKIAFLTAAFCAVLPYNIFEFYFVGTFASVISFIWFAPITLFTYRYIKRAHYRDILCAGTCYGGLILTHLINAYMFAFVITAFLIFMSVAKKRLKALLAIPLFVITGGLIASAYLLPLIFERRFVNVAFFIEKGGGPHFDFRNFFIFPNMTGIFPPDHLWVIYYKTFLFLLIFFCIVIALFLRAKMRKHYLEAGEEVRTVNTFFLYAALGSILLVFGISKFIWEAIPFFEYIQFPVRWLNITFFVTVFLSATVFLLPDYPREMKSRYRYFLILLFLTCVILDFKYINSAPLFSEYKLMPVRAANWNLEHLPAWVKIEKVARDIRHDNVLIVSGEGKADVVTWKSAERVIEVTAQTSVTASVRTFNFPGWKAYTGGVEIPIGTEAGSGAILIDIPQGKHTLTLRFEDTPVRYYGKVISLVSLIIAGVIALVL